MAGQVKLSDSGKKIRDQLGNDKLVGGMKNAFTTPDDSVDSNERTESKPLYGLDSSVKATANKMAKGMKNAFGYKDDSDEKDESQDGKKQDNSITAKVLRYVSFNK